MLASGLDLANATDGHGTWAWTNPTTGAFTGPCNASGILNQSGFFAASPTNVLGDYVYANTPQTPQNLSWYTNVFSQNATTLVCLNSVGPTATNLTGAQLNATWYWNGSTPVPIPGYGPTASTVNTYGIVGNGGVKTAGTNMTTGGWDNNTVENVSSCNSFVSATPTVTLGVNPTVSSEQINLSAWNETHILNYTTDQPFAPCNTYYEMNNNTSYLPSFSGSNVAWAPDEFGYAPSDAVYELPVIFNNTAKNGTYEITVGVTGVTPIAQTFYFNYTAGNVKGVYNNTVLFTFDMTAAWLYDASVNYTAAPNPAHSVEIYGAIGTATTIVSECSTWLVCPLTGPLASQEAAPLVIPAPYEPLLNTAIP